MSEHIPHDMAEALDMLAAAETRAVEAERELSVLRALLPGPHAHRFEWSSGTFVMGEPPDWATCVCGVKYRDVAPLAVAQAQVAALREALADVAQFTWSVGNGARIA